MKFEVGHAIEILERTPSAARALLGRLPTEWTQPNEGPETFSPFDVVGHLIDGEETDWRQRAEIILARGPSVRFEPYDRFRHRARNQGRTLDSLLSEFERLRIVNVEAMRAWHLAEADLDLPGEHPSQGRVTLRQLLAAWVVHDLGHIAQIARVMAKQYRDEVGTWLPFLPVLTDHETPRS